tara:strand:+ start:2700 stop:3101 length:402 start_codon:yes stop_codon:yes gene_type:complete
MSQYLLRNPNDLYFSYLPDDIQEYYPFDFLAPFTSIDTHIFYDILNSLSEKQLRSLNRYIYQQWSLTKQHPEIQDMSPTPRQSDILSRVMTSPNSNENETKASHNQVYNNWIQRDPILSLYFMNQCLTFLLPK